MTEQSKLTENKSPFVAGGRRGRPRYHRLMFWRRLKFWRGGVDWVTALFVALGVVGALSLAAILVIYIVDDEPDRQGSASAPGTAAQRPAQTQTAPAPSGTAPAAPGTPAPPGGQPDQPRSNRIPDNQTFETFRNRAGGYSILAPKGWMEKGSGREASFENRRNYVRIVVNDVQPPRTLAQQRAIIRSEVRPPDRAGRVRQVTVAGQRAVTSDLQFNRNQPNTLLIRRYFFARGGKQATIDLATPQGQAFANLKHYRKVINSFRWS